MEGINFNPWRDTCGVFATKDLTGSCCKIWVNSAFSVGELIGAEFEKSFSKKFSNFFCFTNDLFSIFWDFEKIQYKGSPKSTTFSKILIFGAFRLRLRPPSGNFKI